MKLQYVQEEEERGMLKKCIKGLEVRCVKGGAVPSPTAVSDFDRVLRDIEDDDDAGLNEFTAMSEVDEALRQVDDDDDDQDDEDDYVLNALDSPHNQRMALQHTHKQKKQPSPTINNFTPQRRRGNKEMHDTQYIAKYNFAGDDSVSQITFQENDVITVSSSRHHLGEENTWWWGKTSSGYEGWFPSSYVGQVVGNVMAEVWAILEEEGEEWEE
eukprot:13433199-Ditylum_brightwellii.AAC.1